MSKIGIITILNVNNYGAELQAFALHYKLKTMGFDNEIINYLYYKNPGFQKETKSAPFAQISKVARFKDFALRWIDVLSKSIHPGIAKVRKERFEAFHKKHTSLSKSFKSYSALYNENLGYHTLIVGSDQVWNPNNGTSLEPYFLTFAKPGVRKISYASSFGVGKIDSRYHNKYRDLLNNLDCIATRESDGVKIIKEITGRDSTHVVDPTLLLSKSDWEQFMVPYESNDPYILIFVFKNSDFVTDLAYKIQKETGYKIIRVCKNEMRVESDNKILNIRDFGPAEFLGLYHGASIVLTTSFHGTIFSLIFEKPFYTITPSAKNNNSRQESLLKIAGVPERLIREGNEVDITKVSDIDFNKIKSNIDVARKSSEEYLLTSLSK